MLRWSIFRKFRFWMVYTPGRIYSWIDPKTGLKTESTKTTIFYLIFFFGVLLFDHSFHESSSSFFSKLTSGIQECHDTLQKFTSLFMSNLAIILHILINKDRIKKVNIKRGFCRFSYLNNAMSQLSIFYPLKGLF